MSKGDGQRVRKALSQIKAGNISDIDIKKLKGSDYRARVGDWRIIFRVFASGKITIIDVTRRSEKTYRDY